MNDENGDEGVRGCGLGAGDDLRGWKELDRVLDTHWVLALAAIESSGWTYPSQSQCHLKHEM